MKNTTQKVALIHDLSGVGRCSLGTAIPVLSCLGMQCCPVPTAVLSTQTDGFTGYHFVDLTKELPSIFSHFRQIGIAFDGIYTGFLGSLLQIDLVMDFIKTQRQPNTLVLVDPVMGDDGVLYDVYDACMAEHMRELIQYADIITPNLTEAALLLERPMPKAALRDQELEEWAFSLCELGPDIAVITGAGGHAKENCIVAYDKKKVAYHQIPFQYLPVTYPGTGDLFASVLLGRLMAGMPLNEALSSAADFVSRAIVWTEKQGAPTREGVLFEKLLKEL